MQVKDKNSRLYALIAILVVLIGLVVFCAGVLKIVGLSGAGSGMFY